MQCGVGTITGLSVLSPILKRANFRHLVFKIELLNSKNSSFSMILFKVYIDFNLLVGIRSISYVHC